MIEDGDGRQPTSFYRLSYGFSMLQAYRVVISDHSAMPYLDTGFIVLMDTMWLEGLLLFSYGSLNWKALAQSAHDSLYLTFRILFFLSSA